jgi:surface antigen
MPTIIAYLLLVLLLGTGCALDPAPKPGVKTLVGGAGVSAVGGLLASQLSGGNPVLTAAGALGGLLLGATVGNLLDQRDTSLGGAVHKAVQAPTGTRVPWSDPATRQQGDITSEEWTMQGHQRCRRFTVRAEMDGAVHRLEGCATQRPDGTWEIVQSAPALERR